MQLNKYTKLLTKSDFIAFFGVLFILVLLGSSITYGQEQIGSGGVGGRPAFPRDDNERSKSIFVHTIPNGESIDDGINVINNSDQTKTITVYATDSVQSSDGAFACAQQIDQVSDVGSWVNISKNELTLDSSGSEIVPFSILVPETADTGEHNGCIVVQSATTADSASQGIGLSFRTAIRVAILVPGNTEKNLEIVNFGASTTGDDIVLTPTVKNTGNVSLDTTIETGLASYFGSTISTVGGEFPVLRDQEASWNFKHDSPFWGGWYRTSMTVKYDADASNFLGDPGSDATILKSKGPTVFIAPSIGAIAVYSAVVLSLLVSGAFLMGKYRFKQRVKKAWQLYSVKEGDDLQSLAKDYGVSWKVVAKVNKIKPPYTLSPEQKIKLPNKKN